MTTNNNQVAQLPEEWERTVAEAEEQWQEDRKKHTNPFNLRAYIKAAGNYNEKMRKATFQALKNEQKGSE